MKRIFDDCNAVVWRGQYEVVLDRDLLPKRKEDGSFYSLAHAKHRWIVYTDGPHPKFKGEWNTYSAKRTAILEAQRTDELFALTD